MKNPRWPYKTVVGCSYCLDQSPGAEKFGGLTVTIRWRTGETGSITSTRTAFRMGEKLDETQVPALSEVAEEGVRDAARKLNVDLADLDIIFSDFAYHPLDSHNEIYRHAAGSAFRSAWEAWERWRRFYEERDRQS